MDSMCAQLSIVNGFFGVTKIVCFDELEKNRFFNRVWTSKSVWECWFHYYCCLFLVKYVIKRFMMQLEKRHGNERNLRYFTF